MTRVLTRSPGGTVRHVIHHERAVGWFDLRQLVSTAFKTVASTIIGSMTGRREQMAALDPLPHDGAVVHDYSGQDELWLDYVADTGDGFDATHSIAYLVGRDRLDLGHDGRVPAGQILVFGGDEVYPTASNDQYQARLVDPYYCARPWQEQPRDLFVLPGNHDWYDGLTSFIRLFCQNRQARWIGAWLPQQRRSYFAIRLPHGWWLWGIDLALEDDLDPAQYDYFARHADLLRPHDRVVMCIPEPLWVSAEPPDELGKRPSKLWDKLKLIEDLVIDRGAEIPVWLAGDQHHYARYASVDGGKRHYVTCGGGGAFLLGTHALPKRIELPCGTPAERQRAFPSPEQSRAMRWGALMFFWKSKGFTAALLAVQLALFWLIYLASPTLPGMSVFGPAWWRCLPHSPAAILLLGVIVTGFVGFAESGAKPATPAWVWGGVGLCHAAFHVFAVQFGLWSIAATYGMAHAAWVIMGLAVLYVGMGFVFGGYLLACDVLLGMHVQEVFSCQAIADWKSFLRLHVTEEALTIYPLGVQTICRRWKTAAGVVKKASWRRWDGVRADVLDVPDRADRVYEPAESLSVELIEPPIVIRTPPAGPQRVAVAELAAGPVR